MSPAIRFVHRPLSDEGSPGEAPDTKAPLIDRDAMKASIPEESNAGLFGAFLSWVFRVRKRPRRGVPAPGRKLDPQRWLPKE